MAKPLKALELHLDCNMNELYKTHETRIFLVIFVSIAYHYPSSFRAQIYQFRRERSAIRFQSIKGIKRQIISVFRGEVTSALNVSRGDLLSRTNWNLEMLLFQLR